MDDFNLHRKNKRNRVTFPAFASGGRLQMPRHALYQERTSE